MIKFNRLLLVVAVAVSSCALRSAAQQSGSGSSQATTSRSKTSTDSQPRSLEKRLLHVRESASEVIPKPANAETKSGHLAANSKLPKDRSAPTNLIGTRGTESPQTKTTSSTSRLSSASPARQDPTELTSARHRGANAAVVTGTRQNKSTSSSALNGTQMKRKP
jgi:hypothetical protein